MTTQAFPGQDKNGFQPGMDLRDWFAGQALASILQWRHYDSNQPQFQATCSPVMFEQSDAEIARDIASFEAQKIELARRAASLSYLFADAMIAECATATESIEALPEKWFITVTDENAALVIDWAKRTHSRLWRTTQRGYMHYNGVLSVSPRDGYAKITTDQFRRLVLKQ